MKKKLFFDFISGMLIVSFDIYTTYYIYKYILQVHYNESISILLIIIDDKKKFFYYKWTILLYLL